MIERFGAIEDAMHRAKNFDAFFASSFADDLMDRLEQRMNHADVISLDVFDTVLLRDEKSELSRFRDVAERFAGRAEVREAAPDLTMRACLVARLYCAATAYQLSIKVNGATEGRLNDIARNMMVSLRLPAEMAALWIATELEVEREQLRPSIFADALMARAMGAGKQVILVSDMYLDQSQIAELLTACGLETARYTRLFSSADTHVNKRSGTVFPMIAEEMGLHPYRFLHLGDSLVSDFQRPSQAGWWAQHLPVPDMMTHARIRDHHATCEAVFGRPDYPLPMSVPSL
ncbi:hypothetical protein E7811_06720 [Aliigemmobacter aestuarii]|uniref:HAD family hydrolase n=1 Tax=Aliigemmobacter aestuarii TaxID=1445661 RepID=A0A4S3MTC6_9RHOB|nr:hypothetical protein [Gemmobacter aestuarii]THD85383.1 hypothetical protein E7811_06720 [Gemmobacter aestuarii]